MLQKKFHWGPPGPDETCFFGPLMAQRAIKHAFIAQKSPQGAQRAPCMLKQAQRACFLSSKNSPRRGLFLLLITLVGPLRGPKIGLNAIYAAKSRIRRTSEGPEGPSCSKKQNSLALRSSIRPKSGSGGKIKGVLSPTKVTPELLRHALLQHLKK